MIFDPPSSPFLLSFTVRRRLYRPAYQKEIQPL
jgi:hypothetical protein